MKIVKQLANKVKSAVSGVSTFIPTQLSFWYGGQYVTNQTMNVFSQDLYEKLALLTTNVNNFPAVIFSDGGISKFSISGYDLNIPAISCVFQLQSDQGNSLPYKPYIIAYSSSSILNIGRDDYKKYIYAYVDTSTPDQNPTNVPTILKTFVKSHTPFDDLHYCLICIINENSESIDFSQTNFLVNSAVTTTNNTELLNPQNKINAITPQALSLFSNLGHVDAFDIRVLQNGGYAKDRVIREYDTTGYWVYYQSLIDSNINPKPTLASHVGWMTIAIYETRGGLLSPTYKQIGAGGYSLNEGNRITYHNNDGSSNPCEYGLNGAITNKYTDSTKGFIIGSVQSIGNQGFKMRYNGQKSVTIYGTMVLDASQYPHAIGLLGVELASGITMVSLQAVENLIPSPNNPYNFSSRLIINPGQTASVDVYFNQNVFGWLVNIMVEAQLA